MSRNVVWVSAEHIKHFMERNGMQGPVKGRVSRWCVQDKIVPSHTINTLTYLIRQFGRIYRSICYRLSV